MNRERSGVLRLVGVLISKLSEIRIIKPGLKCPGFSLCFQLV